MVWLVTNHVVDSPLDGLALPTLPSGPVILSTHEVMISIHKDCGLFVDPLAILMRRLLVTPADAYLICILKAGYTFPTEDAGNRNIDSHDTPAWSCALAFHLSS